MFGFLIIVLGTSSAIVGLKKKASNKELDAISCITDGFIELFGDAKAVIKNKKMPKKTEQVVESKTSEAEISESSEKTAAEPVVDKASV